MVVYVAPRGLDGWANGFLVNECVRVLCCGGAAILGGPFASSVSWVALRRPRVLDIARGLIGQAYSTVLQATAGP